MRTEFDRIYAETRQRLRRFLAGALSDAEDREECFQEAYLRLWRQCAKAPPDNPGAWLVVVARRVAARLPGRPMALPDEEVTTLHRTKGSELGRANSVGIEVEIEEALASLGPERRVTFCLRHFGGLSYAEIAEELGIPIGTVASRIHDALEILRRSLLKDLAEERR